MQLVGQAVRHKAFGQGVIKDCSGNIVTISFRQGDKRFIYPDAFAKFLTLKNQSIQNELKAIYKKQLKVEIAQLKAETAQKQALQE